MPASWRARGSFLLLAAILLAVSLPGNGVKSILGGVTAEAPRAEGRMETAKPVAVRKASAQKDGLKNDYICPAHTRIIAEIDGVEVDLGPVLLPELLLDSPDAQLFNQRVERLYQELVRYYQTVEDPDMTWNYRAELADTEMRITLWETGKAGEGQSCTYTVDLETGKFPCLEDIQGNFLPENHAPELVSTRYEGFLEPSWYGTLVLPEILLDSPDAEAVNQEIEAMYWNGLRKAGTPDEAMTAEMMFWDTWWDSVSYAAYQYDRMLSVGIRLNNVFGCVHIIAGWTFDVSTGELLSDREVLARLGAAPEDFSEQLRKHVLEIFDETLAAVLSGDYPYSDAENAQKAYETECQWAREQAFSVEEFPFYVSDTGEIHISRWDSSHRIYGECDCDDWNYEMTLTFPKSAG